jgi:hypothetical protein
MTKNKKPTVESVWKKYNRGVEFKQQLGLYDTVQENENFFIGKQWEGVQANGLPTPVFNFMKRVTMFQVATITSDNIAARVTPLVATKDRSKLELERIAAMVNDQLSMVFERNKIPALLRVYARNAAVDGDSCTYTYFDTDVPNGQDVPGEIVTEIIENTRVHFGNPNSRDVQSQPYIIFSRRLPLEDVQWMAEENGCSEAEIENIKPDEDSFYSEMDSLNDRRVTTLLYLWRDRETKRIHKFECTHDVVISKDTDTKLTLYPVTWLCWDYIQDSMHGQASITGLIPNQVFINRLFAMTMISLMTTAYPKIIYDKTRLPGGWDSRVGAAIAVNGGDVTNIAKIMDPAQISPQIAQFIELAIDYTQNFLGASDVAMGDARPDNTSAIVALQRAANTPLELTKQNLYQSIEDLCKIHLDQMRAFYGTRVVELKGLEEAAEQPFGIPLDDMTFMQEFDFSTLKDFPTAVRTDVGASSYWSEIASMQTLDNLLMQGKIGLVEYLERVPSGYVSKRQELLDWAKQQQTMAQMAQMAPMQPEQAPEDLPIRPGAGNGALQRAIANGGT